MPKILFRKLLTLSLTILINFSFFLSGLLSNPISAADYSMADPNNYNLRFDGEAPGDYLGGGVSLAGDVNNDGWDDLIIGANSNDVGGLNAGRAYIFFGGTSIDVTPDVIFTGEAAGDIFGSSVSSAGDVNSDGYDDVIVGAPRNDAGGADTGRAYIFFGGDSMSNKSAADADIILTGKTAGDYFSYLGGISSAGDVNNDGYDDVLVGAPYNDVGGSNAGRVYIYFGGSPMDATEDVTFTGKAAADQFGTAVSFAGDVNNDDYDDVIVGARLNDTGGTDAGRAYIFFGGSSMDSTADVTLTGITAGDWFGVGVSSARDINNDGYSDVIVGASENDIGATDAGQAYIFFGGSSMDVIPDVIFTGEAADDSFGDKVRSIGDINNDDYVDIAIGAQYSDIGGSNAGAVYIFFGGSSIDTTADIKFTGKAAGDRFGMSLFSAGDTNADGRVDLLIGANVADNNGTDSGSVYLIYNFPHTITLDTVASYLNDNTPAITGLVSATNSISTIEMVQYSVDDNSFDGNWQDCIADDGTFDSKEEDYTCNVVSTLSEGEHTVYIRSYDENISYTAQESYGATTFTVDTISPTGEILINSGREYTGSQTVGLTISATDVILGDSTSVAISNISLEMIICNEETYTGCSWENYDTSKSWTLTEGDGTKTVYTKFRDEAENESETVTDTIIVDTTSPTGSININSGETITNTDEVTLTLLATDNLTEVKKMMVSNKGDYRGGSWETYNTSKEWRLSMGDGEKKVYVKYRDEVGNISSSYSDSIEMDMGSPTGTLIINEGEEYTSSREVVLHITGEDEVTGVEEMRISEDRTMEGVDWEGYTTSREYTLSEGDGYKVIYIQYRDGIGNESEVYGSNITLDSNTEIEVTEIGEEEVEGEIENWETEETTPTFTGEGEVGATITIEIEGIETGTVIVNEDGVWSWTPSIELTRGQEYNIIIISTDLAGNEDTQTFTLGISDEEVIEVNQTTPEAQITTTQLPNTGVILIIGLMVMGGLFWIGVNFKVIEKLRKLIDHRL